ncbi:MAG: hypothetical protein NTY15_09570 [Planctomycetota bacterium]|nr:hypothetical protein [Planctomycetota bacterium]
MDAASKFKAFIVALVASFGTISVAYGDDSDPKSPCIAKESCTAKEYRTGVVPKSPCTDGVCCDGQVCEVGKCADGKCIHGNCNVAGNCDVDLQLVPSKTGIAAFVSEWLSKSPRFSLGFAVHYGDSEQAANDLPRVELQKLDPRAGKTQVSSSIARPMRFTQQVPKVQLGELVSDVIICGHRICSGNKCYDVKDEPVTGKACDKSEEANVVADEELEQILVLPLAPPPPPGVDIALDGDGNAETEAASILRNSGLGNVSISLPVTTVVDLLVANTELSTRLEMTSQLMDERQASMDKLQSLAHRNATLATQLAVAEARNQMSDALTASVMERAELVVKLAALDSTSSKAPSTNAVKTIQEDLSNIRRQIALLRRSPVPFAQSYVGIQPYVPTAQLPKTELTCEGDETSNIAK